MRLKAIFTTTFAIWIAGCLCEPILAKESQFNEQLSVGEQAPAFSEMPGIDGKKHGLAEYKDAKAVVVMFTSNHFHGQTQTHIPVW